MRRRRLLIWVGSLLAVIAVTALWVRATDEYGFLDKYQPTRTLENVSPIWGPRNSTRWIRTFTFKKTTPELLGEIREVFVLGQGDPAKRKRTSYDHEANKLTVYDDPGPSWIDLQWDALKQTLGMGP